MLTLGIETSCDETAVSVVNNSKVLSSEVSSSVHLHSVYGGVVPEIASRYHTEYIYSVFNKAINDAGCDVKEIELAAVTKEPGLPGSLLVGLAFARAFCAAAEIPLIEVNHLQGHLLSCFIDKDDITLDDIFPFLGAVVSGGHTSIYVCRGYGEFDVIGRTKDDAVGEAFDKVSKVMGLGYPGGPVVEQRALEFSGENAIRFPRALLTDKNDIDFSFSGIKTSVMYYWKDSSKAEEEINRICYSFQEAVTDVIVEKISRASGITGINRLGVGGGVVNNKHLRDKLIQRCGKENIQLYLPFHEYCADNAAMVAVLGEKLYNI